MEKGNRKYISAWYISQPKMEYIQANMTFPSQNISGKTRNQQLYKITCAIPIVTVLKQKLKANQNALFQEVSDVKINDNLKHILN